MHTWNWNTWNNLPYLTCSLLEPWAHGFFTQQFWSRSPAELSQVLHSTAVPFRVKQVHGNEVLSPSEIVARVNESEELVPGDGLISDRAQQAVWVCSADCTPVLIADRVTGQVSAVHAGWRGTAQKIVPAAIARLQTQGSQLENLRIAMGPAIAGEQYQVSEQVAAEVGQTIALALATHSADPLSHLANLENPPILPDPEPGRVRLDVRRVIALQLEQMGIPPEQVAIAPHCTFQEPEYFFSYRRTAEKKVQWSGIVSQEVSQEISQEIC